MSFSEMKGKERKKKMNKKKISVGLAVSDNHKVKSNQREKMPKYLDDAYR